MLPECMVDDGVLRSYRLAGLDNQAAWRHRDTRASYIFGEPKNKTARFNKQSPKGPFGPIAIRSEIVGDMAGTRANMSLFTQSQLL